MDLNVVYSKTPKGLRARPSLIGGLSSQLMKVLADIDGATKAETILQKHDELTEIAFVAALTQLEKDGYIKAVGVAESSDEEWALTTNFMPMEVEEFQGTISAVNTEDDEAQAESQAKLQANLKAKVKEEARLQAEAKAREKEEQALAKAEENAQLEAEASKKAELKAADAAEENRAKVQADAKEKAKREIERMKLEAAEAKKHADAEAKIEAQLKAEADRKSETEAAERKKIELEAAAAAESARAKAEAADAAEENARRENERVAREAEAAQKQAELEARARAEAAAQLEAEREAEAQAKREAEAAEQARLQAAQQAKEEEEARLQAEREAEARKKAALEAEAEAEKVHAKAEAEENARLESERIIREAEEARLEAERKAATAEEARLEAERKAIALEEARLKAEAKLKALAEQNRSDAEIKEKASTDANLKASLAMQSFAIDSAAAQPPSAIEIETKAELSAPTEQKPKSAAARLKAELKAKISAEQRVLAVYNAEQKALADEKEVARREMERISLEAEAERLKQTPSASPSANSNPNPSANPVDKLSSSPDTSPSTDAVEVRWENDDESDLEEERIAEEVEKVGTEIKKKAKRVAEVEGREGIIRGAKEEALLKAKIKRYDGRIVLINAMSKLSALIRKSLLIYLPPAILLILALLHIVNISPLVAPIEKLATESFGAPVKIDEVRASLWPRPHLVLKNVLIGAESGQKIDAINIIPATSTLYDEIKTLRSLEMSGLKIAPENFALPQHLINSLSKAPHLKVEQIKLSKIVLQIRDFESAPLKGNVVLNESRALKSLDLKTEDDTLAIQITPQGSNFDIALTGTNFALPMNPKFVLNELKATGSMNQNQILFSAFEGTIYSGNFTGKAALDWSNQWSVAGNFNLKKAMAQEMLAALNSSASIDGRFNLNGTFSSKSNQAAKLADALELSAGFDVQNGKIKGVELERAVLSKGAQSLAGNATRFDRLTGSVKIKNGSYQYRQLALKGDQFRASGNVDIKPNQDVSGNISADLSAQSRSLQAQFDLAGKVNSVKRQ